MATEAHPQHYHPALKILHWLIVILVIAQIPLGFLQFGTGDGLYNAINLSHVNLGFTLLLLMMIRLGVRLGTHTPDRLAGTPTWDAMLAGLNHRLLYLMLICQPILGLLVTDAQGFPLTWLSVIPIWDPIGKSPAATALLTAHHYLTWAIVALVVLHICGALYHRVIRRDGTLVRIT
jgi:cytochrome b561